MIAALFVATGGTYFGLPDVDPWDEARDARTYAGPHAVVAHPPCARWCRLAKLVESRTGKRVGDDGGTFASALASVRRFGGVLEHPAWSMAWPAHGLQEPPSRGWLRTHDGEWVCEVSQAAYGHRAQKLTWLLYVGTEPPPSMNWRKPPARGVVSGMRNNCGRPLTERVWQKEASATPPAFRDLLLSIAATARAKGEI